MDNVTSLAEYRQRRMHGNARVVYQEALDGLHDLIPLMPMAGGINALYHALNSFITSPESQMWCCTLLPSMELQRPEQEGGQQRYYVELYNLVSDETVLDEQLNPHIEQHLAKIEFTQYPLFSRNKVIAPRAYDAFYAWLDAQDEAVVVNQALPVMNCLMNLDKAGFHVVHMLDAERTQRFFMTLTKGNVEANITFDYRVLKRANALLS